MTEPRGEHKSDSPRLSTADRETDNGSSIVVSDATGEAYEIQRLRTIESRLNDFLDKSADMIYTTDLKGNILTANRAVDSVLGFRPGEAVGMNMIDVVPPEQQPLVRGMVQRKLAGESVPIYETEFITRDGLRLAVEVSSFILYEDGEPVALQGIARDITERKRAARELQSSQERFAKAFSAAPVAMVITRLSDGTVLDANEATLRTYGYLRDEFIGQQALDLGMWLSTEIREQVINELRTTGRLRDVPVTLRNRQGDIRRFNLSAELITLNDEVCGLWVSNDVTDRMQAEDLLRQSEERYRAFIANSMEAIWRYEMEQPIAVDQPLEAQMDQFYHRAVLAECNDTMAQMYGYRNASEFVGTRLEEMLPILKPHNLENLRTFVENQYRSIEVGSEEVDRFGQTKYFLNNFTGIVENGFLTRVWGTQRDITRRRRAEQLLRGQQRILESIATGAPLCDVLRELIVFVEERRPGMRGSILLVNPEGDRLTFGAAPSLPEAFNMHVDGLPIGEGIGTCGTAAFRREPVVVEDVMTDPLWIGHTAAAAEFGFRSCWSNPVFSASGAVLATFALYRDQPSVPDTAERDLIAAMSHLASVAIEHAQAERALRVSEERFSKAFSSSPNAIAIVSARDGIVIDANEAFSQVSGYRRDELIGQGVRELGLVADENDLEMISRDLTANIPVRNRELMGRNKRGELRSQLVSLEVVELNSEPCLLCAVTDITERQRAEAALRDSEERLRQSQKMEAVGRLAGGIAHDFNNILTGIIGYSDMTLVRIERDHPLRRNLEEIRKAADRAANLTHQLLAYSRRQILQPSLLDVNAIVLEMDQMLRRLIGEDIVLRTDLGRINGHIRADRGQLEQVLMNLAVNARDAMPKGGALTLTTGALDLNSIRQVGPFKLRPGNWVHLSVTDTGAGMTEEVLSQVFEPFFTTKEVGKGTGLGLATVYGIVKQSGGYINVESEPGHGARFDIYLPRFVEEPTGLAPTVDSAFPQGFETVLLIEDDTTVRRLTREVLELAGYRVLEARDGDEALRIGSGNEAIQLLLTDVVMPRQSGREIAELLTAQRPELRVLYMSGYTDDAIVQHGVLEPGLDFIQKPFSPDALARRVRAVLDR